MQYLTLALSLGKMWPKWLLQFPHLTSVFAMPGLLFTIFWDLADSSSSEKAGQPDLLCYLAADENNGILQIRHK